MESPTQSGASLPVFFRTLVMLGFLFLMPIAAVFGTSLPGLLRSWRKQANPHVAPASGQANGSAHLENKAQGALPGGPWESAAPLVELAGGIEGQESTLGATQADYEVLSSAPATSDPPQDRFAVLEQRLRELGATYYLLETWGTDMGLYRFHCKMAIAGNPEFNRYFEVTDADPLNAMERVLTQVEAWHSSQELH